MPYLVDLLRGRLRSAEHGPLGAGMGDAGLDALAKDLAFEFGEHRQHPGEGTTARCRHVEGFGEGDEADSEFDQLFERDHEIGERTAPPVQLQTTMASTSRRRTAASNSSRFGRWSAPDPTSLISVEICQPLRSAYSRMAVIWSGSVC